MDINFLISVVGICLATGGSILSIIGTLINNLRHNHVGAMKIWGFSNPMLATWAVGYLMGWWNGSLSVGAMLVMYLVFTITNWWGLMKYKEAAK